MWGYFIEYGHDDDDDKDYNDDDKDTIPYPVAIVLEVADSKVSEAVMRMSSRSEVWRLVRAIFRIIPTFLNP